MPQKYSYSDARQRAAEHKSGFDSKSIKLPEGVKAFKVEAEGIMRLDIIPFVTGKGNPHADEGVLHYERSFFIHRDVGADSDAYICPRETAKQPCPICEYQRKLKQDPDADSELIKSLYPKERQLFQVINTAKPKDGIQVWDVSYHTFGKMLDAQINNADEGENLHLFYHLRKGMTLKVGFIEKPYGKGRTFFAAETIAFKPRAEPYDEEILEKGHCLDELLVIPEYDDLKAAFLEEARKGKDEGEDDVKPKGKPKPAADDDDDVKPRGGKPKPTDDDDDIKPRRAAPVDDDDDIKPKGKPKPAPADDDDDVKPKGSTKPGKDEDWDADKEKGDDDDDIKPKGSSKPKPAADDDEGDPEPVGKSGKKPTKPADDWED